MTCLFKLREFLSVLSITNVYNGTNEYANDLIESIMEKLTELRGFLEEEAALEEEFLFTICESNDSEEEYMC